MPREEEIAEEPAIRLRPEQKKAVEAVLSELASVRATLITSPTGTGKTLIYAEVIRRHLESHPGSRVMVIAHRGELLAQGAESVRKICGIEPELEKAEYRASRGDEAGSTLHLDGLGGSKVVMASVQTLGAGPKCKICDAYKEKNPDAKMGCTQCLYGKKSRMREFKPSDFSLIVVDESHHSTAPTYRTILEYFSHSKVFGLTATADRLDEESLGQVYDSVAYEWELQEAIADGWLVDIRQLFITVDDLDLSRAKFSKKKGDLQDIDVTAAMERVTRHEELHKIAQPVLKSVGDRPTLVFCCDVNQATRLQEIFNAYREGSAVCLHGKTPDEERSEALARFDRREFQFLVNCQLFTEGLDVPAVSCVVMARPTASRSLYAQMIGRGTRTVSGLVDGCKTAAERRTLIAESEKPDLLVLDFVGNSGQHKLINTGDVLAGNVSSRALGLAAAKARKSGEVCDMLELAEEAEEDVKEEAKKALENEHFLIQAKFEKQERSPFAILDIGEKRVSAWQRGQPPTEGQINCLKKMGLRSKDLSKVTNKTHAGQLITEIISRRKNDKCTWKQARTLVKYGEDPDMSFRCAQRTIDRIAANNWKKLPMGC